MVLADWDRFQASPFEFNDGLDISNPIIGTGSYSIDSSATNSTAQGAIATLDNTFTRGLTKGRIRTLVRFDADNFANYGASASTSVGPIIFYMCNNLDPTSTNTTFYATKLVMNGTNLVTPVIYQRKTNSDIVTACGVGNGNNLADGASQIAITADDHIPMQIEWNLDIPGLGGIRHTLSLGAVNDNDFSGLSVIYDVLDTSSPITTSVVEGIGFIYFDGSPSFQTGNLVTFDNTGIFQLV